MKHNDFLTPLASRLAVITLALTAVLGTPAAAKPAATRNNVSRGAPSRPGRSNRFQKRCAGPCQCRSACSECPAEHGPV